MYDMFLRRVIPTRIVFTVIALLFCCALLVPGLVSAQTDNPHQWGDDPHNPHEWGIDDDDDGGDDDGDDGDDDDGGGGGNGSGNNGEGADPTDTSTFNRVSAAVYNFVIGFFGMAAHAGAMVLNQSMEYFVRQYAELYQSSFGHAVEIVWQAIRDLVNLALIFGLIYIGFRFILSSDDSGAKRNLVMLIIAALLVNFSLFFSKAVIDLTHVAANSFEESIVPARGGDRDIAGAFASTLNFSSILSDGNRVGNDQEVSASSIWGVIFLTAAVLLVAAFVFAAVGFLLIVRFIVLTFLLMTSPVAVLGMIFPNMQSLSSRWMRLFLGQAFLAPIMMLMLYASLMVLSGMSVRVHSGGLMDNSGIIGTGGDVLQALPYYLLGIGFLLATLVISKQLGAYGAQGTISVGKRLAGHARSAALSPVRLGGRVGAYAAGAAGRNVVGSAGRSLSNSRTVQRWAGSSGWRGVAGKAGRATGDAAAAASYDVRRVGGVGKKLGIGEGKKRSYDQSQKDREKKEKERAKRMGQFEDPQIYEDNGVTELYEKHQEILQERDRRIAELTQTSDENRRRRLTEQIHEIEGSIAAFESSYSDGSRPPEFLGTDEQWEAKVQQLQRYNNLRTGMRRAQQNRYAAVVAQRGQGLPFGVRQAYHLVTRSQEENEAIAASIRTEAGKDPTARLIDAVGNINLNNE